MQAGQIADKKEFIEIIRESLPKEIGEETMTFEQICINKGVNLGEKKALENVAYKLICDGEPLERIAKVTNLSLEEIERIQQK